MNHERREFLQQITISGACVLCCGTVGMLLSSCENPEEPSEQENIPITEGEPIINLAAESSLQNAGGAVKKRYSTFNDRNTIIIVRLSTTSFAAYDARCTHQGTVIELPVNSVMTCLNHGSKFSTSNGGVIQGPATSALKKFTTTFNSEKNTVTIS